jgi:hypothetical protein
MHKNAGATRPSAPRIFRALSSYDIMTFITEFVEKMSDLTDLRFDNVSRIC